MKPETVDEIFRRCNCWILRADIRRVLEALTATPEYQALVKDVARYRWLRDDAMHGTRHDPAIAVVDDIEDVCLFGADADAAIDAARNG